MKLVVSAFGIKRNADEIGAAVTKVDGGLITQAKATNAASALSGKVAGLQINTVNAGVNPDVRVILRGNRSFLGNNQALLVLDGVPVNLAYLSTLNPNDIESMNVLKGGNAAALYGSEAANGVIVVTTKSGSRDKTIIQFSNTITFDKVSFFPNFRPGLAQVLHLMNMGTLFMILSKTSAGDLNLTVAWFRSVSMTSLAQSKWFLIQPFPMKNINSGIQVLPFRMTFHSLQVMKQELFILLFRTLILKVLFRVTRPAAMLSVLTLPRTLKDLRHLLTSTILAKNNRKTGPCLLERTEHSDADSSFQLQKLGCC